MSYNSRVYRILIASPSDVGEEREVAAKVIQEWNDLYSLTRKVTLLPLRWETHVAPGSNLSTVWCEALAVRQAMRVAEISLANDGVDCPALRQNGDWSHILCSTVPDAARNDLRPGITMCYSFSSWSKSESECSRLTSWRVAHAAMSKSVAGIDTPPDRALRASSYALRHTSSSIPSSGSNRSKSLSTFFSRSPPAPFHSSRRTIGHQHASPP